MRPEKWGIPREARGKSVTVFAQASEVRGSGNKATEWGAREWGAAVLVSWWFPGIPLSFFLFPPLFVSQGFHANLEVPIPGDLPTFLLKTGSTWWVADISQRRILVALILKPLCCIGVACRLKCLAYLKTRSVRRIHGSQPNNRRRFRSNTCGSGGK